MSEVGRRQFGALALLGGVGLITRLVRDLDGDLLPTRSDPSVAEGRVVCITLPNGRAIRRVCRKGHWVTAGPAD